MRVCVYIHVHMQCVTQLQYVGKDDTGIEIFIREAVESRKDHSFLSAGGYIPIIK